MTAAGESDTATHVRADGVGGEILRRAVQPAGQHRMARELPGILRERDKHTLRYILRQVGIANHPKRGGINEVNTPAHQLGKRRLRPVPGIVL